MSEYRLRVAEAIVAARESVDVSQRELADRLGRDKRTIQKWEKGEMKIALEDFLEIFEALKVQVEPYSKWVRHPELFPNGLADISGFATDKKRGALADFYKCQASPLEVEQEYYFLFADHGSDYHGMYQQWMANLMAPLRDRRRICAQVIDNYTESAGYRHDRRPRCTSAKHGSVESLLRGQLSERSAGQRTPTRC